MAVDKTVQIPVTAPGVDEAAEKFQSLRRQIKETRLEIERFSAIGDEAGIQKSKARLDELEDAFKKTKVQSKQFLDNLESLPGPLGNVASKVNTAVDTLKGFSAIKLQDIKTQFVDLRKDVIDIGSALLKATGITKIYTVTVNASSAAMRAFGVSTAVATTAAKAFSVALVATGVGALVVALGLAVSSLMDFISGSNEAKKASDDLSKSITDLNSEFDAMSNAASNYTRKVVAEMKAAGKSQKEIRDFELQQTYNDYSRAYDKELALRKKYNESLGKVDSDSLDKIFVEWQKSIKDRDNAETDFYVKRADNRTADNEDAKAKQKKADDDAEAARKKRKEKNDQLLKEQQAENKRIADQKIKDNETARNAIRDAEDAAYAKSIKDEEQRALVELSQKKERRIIELQKSTADKKIIDEAILALEKEFQIDKTNIETEFSDKRKKKAKEDLLEQQQIQREITQTTLQAKFDELDRTNKLLDNDFKKDLERLAQQKDILNELEASELSNTELNEAERTRIKQEYADRRREITNAEVETERLAQEAKTQLLLQYAGAAGNIGKILQTIAGKNKKVAKAGILIEQAANVGRIVIDTKAAIAKSIRESPKTFGLPWSAFSAIQGALGVTQSITAAKKAISDIDKVDTGGASDGGGGGSVSAQQLPAFTAGGSAQAPSLGTGGESQTGQLANIVATAVQRDTSRDRPIRAYVVGDDIRTNEQLNRRLRTSARL